MKKLKFNRFGFIFLCAVFNILFEYSARGVREFISRPLFILALFGIYFTYFAMLEDLVVRFKLRNSQIFLVAFLYGLFPIAFLTGNLFNENIYFGLVVAGINLGTLIIVGIFAWGVVQGILTLYFANSLLPRDWNHKKMGAVGWFLMLLYQVFIMVIAHGNPVTPRGTTIGYVVFGILVIICLTLFLRSLKKTNTQTLSFKSSILMDVLAFSSVIIFFILGTLFTSGETIVTSQPLNRLATVIENIWVFFCGIVFFAYRILRGSDVAV